MSYHPAGRAAPTLRRPRRRFLQGLAAAAAGGWMPALRAQGSADAQRWFRRPQMLGAGLSPDGRLLAMRTVAPHGRVVLSVLDLATMKPEVAYSSDGADVAQVVWINTQRLAFTLADLETPDGQQDAGPGLFAVDINGQNLRQLVERRGVFARAGGDGQALEPWNTFLLSRRSGTAAGAAEDEVLVVRPEAFGDKDWGYAKLLRLNTRTRRSAEVDAPLHSVGWWADREGELRVVQTREGEKSALRWLDPAQRQWKVLAEFNSYTGDGAMHVSHVASDGKLYVSARRGQDKMATWLLDPASGEWSAAPLAQSPQFDVDAWVVATQDRVLGLRMRVDAEVTQWLDPDMAAFQAQIDKVLPRTVNRLSVPWQGASPWVLVEAFADIQPTLFLLFNRETKKFVRLGAERPDIDAKTQASADLHHLKARDGEPLPTWLTLPKGRENQKLPLVVWVHGGPFAPGPQWTWDAEVQFLAAQGYAVLQPQFRGTLGLGDKHHRGGWRQWGQAMQTDVADATRWAIEKGLADPKRIAIMGASYGGYATLMGLVRDADLFRCGVAWVGVTDLDMLHSVKWDDISDSFKQHGLPAVLGDRVKDADMLKAQSPLTHAARIRQPLLLAYGGKDRRVPMVHGETFRKAVQPHNPDLEWVVYPEEGHGWRAPATHIDFWSRVAAFLAKHLAV